MRNIATVKYTKKIGSTVASALALALAFATPALANDKVVMRLPWIANVQAAAYIIAFEKGFYRDAGLDVEIRPGSVQVNPNQLVASGDEHFGANDSPNIITGVSRGMPLVAVAACWQKHPGGLYMLESSGIKAPKDLIGKRLAYDEGGPWTLIKAMLSKSGVKLDQINTVNASGNEVLMKGTVDARSGFVINGPVAIELAGMKTTAMPASDYGISAAAEVIFTNKKMIAEKPDVVRRFVEATVKGYKYAYSNREETLKIVLANNPQLAAEQQRRQLDLQAGLIFTERAAKQGLCSFDRQDVASTVDVLREFGGLTGQVDVDAMINTSFVPAP
ncbi:ABC transporter substrate-binding protein [Microvirga alba]|uniref:Thiamine pyrimidine synthase n=1 Tax=Microvirga alba TaxID=2791025 RepID=A0A931BUU1_9HYPH|nr:ABC transporter substrate-binding protein [Microvirga alba]MBF9235139.1 ABC transporter substrate-binding protein [Microvirga alba]